MQRQEGDGSLQQRRLLLLLNHLLLCAPGGQDHLTSGPRYCALLDRRRDNDVLLLADYCNLARRQPKAMVRQTEVSTYSSQHDRCD